MSDVRTPIYAALAALGIGYELFEHPPVFTAEEAALHWAAIPGAAVKNLFLRNKKGDRHYLVILGIEKQADLRHLVKVIGDDRLSFGSPERLNKHLGVTPGQRVAARPDSRHAATASGSSSTAICGAAERLIFHPNDNTASLTISGEDFVRFLEQRGIRQVGQL